MDRAQPRSLMPNATLATSHVHYDGILVLMNDAVIVLKVF
jgi:hypothetical protein